MFPLDPRWLQGLTPFHLGVFLLLVWGYWRAGTYERTLRRLEGWLEKKDKELEEKQKENKELVTEKEDILKLLHKVELQLVSAEASKNLLTGTVEKMDAHVLELERKVDVLQNTIEGLTETLEKKNGRISHLEVEVSSLKKERDRLKLELQAALSCIENVPEIEVGE